MKRKFIIVVAVVAVVIAVVTVVFLVGGPPNIPADHEGRTTCFECHETGANGAPVLPQSHLDKIDKGTLDDNITACLECHDQAA